MDMDKTPKERIVFDEGVYYGDEGSEISIEDITSREGIAVEEVLDSYTEEEIFENAMNMMDIDRSEELAGLKAFLDGSDNPLSSYDNPLGGNRIIARGSIGRWDGTRHGMTAYRDFDDMMSGPASVFKDCEIGKVWDENGGLFIHGYHHDGGVDVEVRQLTDAGEEALDVIEDAWYGEPFTSGGKEYDGSRVSGHRHARPVGGPRPVPHPALHGACVRMPCRGVRGTGHRPASRSSRVHAIRHHERRGRSGRCNCDRA